MKKDVIEEQSINDVNYEKLKELFPHAVSVDENGKYVIDSKKLQMSLDPSLAEIREDGYGLNWVGKKEAYHSAFSKNYKVLKPLHDEAISKNWDETENILIKGDNLDALKILRHNYFEAIKMIYIDPPYNTKNDGFVYNDNFTSSTEQTLEELGYDKEYIDYIENIQGAKTHSGWLSFMYPRLLLARDLLKDDGVIFISIDDNEVAQLRLLCDEVFGEDNFVANSIWEKKYTIANDAKWFSDNHDHILIYAKNKEIWRPNLLSRTEEMNERYSNPDNHPKGPWKATPLHAKSGSDNSEIFSYKFKNGVNWSPPSGTYPRFSKETLENYDKENEIWFGKDGKSVPSRKTFLCDLKSDGIVPRTIWKYDDVGHNHEARQELNALFSGNSYFDTPKPVRLIKRIIEIGSNSNDLILDFFAGSGTTAHAVMDLNAKDGENRKFICVQWAEETPQKSEARKAGYETIFDITKERIKRAGEKILHQVQNDENIQAQRDGLLHSVRNDGSSGDHDGGLDVGFRTFEVVEDTKQKIYQKSLEEMTQEDLLSFMSKPSIENNEEILYNLFVAENLSLSVKYETLIQNKLYLAHNVAFVLGDINSDALVVALKNKKECEYITVYSPAISDDKFTLEIESNISKLGIKPDKLRFRG